METPDFKQIAGQLRNPHGAAGKETALRMAENNDGMINACIDRLPLQAGDEVLEIGPGGGAHLPYLLTKANNLKYDGADISETMIQMATEAHPDLVADQVAVFSLATLQDGYAGLPYASDRFDCIFTVNTIYFWDNAPAQALEIYRTLKPGGVFVTGFATEAFMQGLPFTQYGFNLYTPDKTRALLENAGFMFSSAQQERETIYSNAGPLMERDFIIMTVTKPAHQGRR